MKKALLPIVFVALACGDGNPFQPDGQPPVNTEQPALAISQDQGGSQKWSFHCTVDNWVNFNVEDPRVTPSGVMHFTNYVNRWDMVGDLVGYWWFQGDVHWVTWLGKGRNLSRPVLVEVFNSSLGKSGTFECVGSFKFEFFGTPSAIQHGNVSGCRGTGDFEGMRMNAYVSNEANPGTDTYDFWGEIW